MLQQRLLKLSTGGYRVSATYGPSQQLVTYIYTYRNTASHKLVCL